MLLFRQYIHTFWYAVIDYLMASIAWGLFYFLRKSILDEPFTIDYKFWLGVIFIPGGWLIIYGLVGAYHSVYRKSRLAEITMTFICSAIGSIILFFLFLIDDAKSSNSYYYIAFLTLSACHFLLTITGRLFILNVAKSQLIKKIVRFKAAIVGTPLHLQQISKEVKNNLGVEGFEVVGFISSTREKNTAVKELPPLGVVDEIENIID